GDLDPSLWRDVLSDEVPNTSTRISDTEFGCFVASNATGDHQRCDSGSFIQQGSGAGKHIGHLPGMKSVELDENAARILDLATGFQDSRFSIGSRNLRPIGFQH